MAPYRWDKQNCLAIWLAADCGMTNLWTNQRINIPDDVIHKLDDVTTLSTNQLSRSVRSVYLGGQEFSSKQVLV